METSLEGTCFWGSLLEQTIFSGTHIDGANFGGTHLEGADFVEAHLEGANFSGAHLEGADLSWAIVNENTSFRDIDIDDATIPLFSRILSWKNKNGIQYRLNCWKTGGRKKRNGF